MRLAYASYKKKLAKPHRVKFPPYLWFSQNLYNPGWFSAHYHRLKNITMLMEWVPRPEQLVPMEDAEHGGKARTMTGSREAFLRKAFDMFDVGR